jgi:hypothetical protein
MSKKPAPQQSNIITTGLMAVMEGENGQNTVDTGKNKTKSQKIK